jgi:hypothetical protein
MLDMLDKMLDKILKWWYAKPRGMKVAKVLAFDSDDVRVEYLKWDPVAFRGDWWDHVAAVAGFTPSRVEFRIVDNGKKRRAVLYPGTPCDPEFPMPRVVIVNATLVPQSDAKPVDVTNRVQKYIGNPMPAAHMFPFDDPDALQERWKHMRVLGFGLTRGFTLAAVDVPLVPAPPTPQVPQEEQDPQPVALG